MPGTTHVVPCQNGAPKPKEQRLYLWQCPPTRVVPFMQGLVMQLCSENTRDASQRSGSHLLAIPHPHSLCWVHCGPLPEQSRWCRVLLGQGLVPVVLELIDVRLLPPHVPPSNQSSG